MSQINVNSNHNWVFWLHVVITMLAWVGPFLFSWYLLVPVYLMVLLQFRLFNRCLMNAGHEMDDTNATFYTYLLNSLNIRHDAIKLKRLVRNELYLIMSGITLLWQLILEFPPLLF